MGQERNHVSLSEMAILQSLGYTLVQIGEMDLDEVDLVLFHLMKAPGK